MVGPSNTGGNGLAPVYTCDPGLDGTDVGDKLLDINCISVPAFGELGELVPPYNLRTPTRMNTDITLFKNFEIKGDQKLQFRVGFFNVFNQAFANTFIGGDVDLTLDTRCKVRVAGVPNGAGGTVDALRPDQGLRVHAADDRQLREDQPEARPPRHRAGPEGLLLAARGTPAGLPTLVDLPASARKITENEGESSVELSPSLLRPRTAHRGPGGTI